MSSAAIPPPLRAAPSSSASSASAPARAWTAAAPPSKPPPAIPRHAATAALRSQQAAATWFHGVIRADRSFALILASAGTPADPTRPALDALLAQALLAPDDATLATTLAHPAVRRFVPVRVPAGRPGLCAVCTSDRNAAAIVVATTSAEEAQSDEIIADAQELADRAVAGSYRFAGVADVPPAGQLAAWSARARGTELRRAELAAHPRALPRARGHEPSQVPLRRRGRAARAAAPRPRARRRDGLAPRREHVLHPRELRRRGARRVRAPEPDGARRVLRSGCQGLGRRARRRRHVRRGRRLVRLAHAARRRADRRCLRGGDSSSPPATPPRSPRWIARRASPRSPRCGSSPPPPGPTSGPRCPSPSAPSSSRPRTRSTWARWARCAPSWCSARKASHNATLSMADLGGGAFLEYHKCGPRQDHRASWPASAARWWRRRPPARRCWPPSRTTRPTRTGEAPAEDGVPPGAFVRRGGARAVPLSDRRSLLLDRPLRRRDLPLPPRIQIPPAAPRSAPAPSRTTRPPAPAPRPRRSTAPSRSAAARR